MSDTKNKVGCGAEGPLVSASCIRLTHDDGRHDDGRGTRWTDEPCDTCGTFSKPTVGCEECTERRLEGIDAIVDAPASAAVEDVTP